MHDREATIILQTANHLFRDQKLDRLWCHPMGLSYQATLDVLDKLCNFISFNNEFIFHDRASENASNLVELIISTPLFNLREVERHIKKSGFTDSGRFARRMNQKLFGIYNLLDANDFIDKDMEYEYAALQDGYLKQLAVPCPNSG